MNALQLAAADPTNANTYTATFQNQVQANAYCDKNGENCISPDGMGGDTASFSGSGLALYQCPAFTSLNDCGTCTGDLKLGTVDTAPTCEDGYNHDENGCVNIVTHECAYQGEIIFADSTIAFTTVDEIEEAFEQASIENGTDWHALGYGADGVYNDELSRENFCDLVLPGSVVGSHSYHSGLYTSPTFYSVDDTYRWQSSGSSGPGWYHYSDGAPVLASITCVMPS